MAWMKLDDQFHASRKLNSIPKRHRFQAAGLWAIAGSWVAGQGTDGFVPEYMIKAWGPTDKTVSALVEADLWRETPGGFSFVAWLEYNPSKAQTEAERAASAERMRLSRERRRRESNSNRLDSDHEQSTNEGRTRRESTANEGHSDHEQTTNVGHSDLESDECFSVSADQGAFRDDVAAQQSEVLRSNALGVLQRPDPTRPDPTPKEGEVVGQVQVAHAREEAPSPESWDEALAAVAAGPPTPPGPELAPLDQLAADHTAATAEIARGDTPDVWSTPADPRCRQHAGLSREDVPACGSCATVREWFTRQESEHRRAHRAAIDGCSMCDDRGLVDTFDESGTPVVVRCDHTGPPPRVEPVVHEHFPRTSADLRRNLLASLNRSPSKTDEKGPPTPEHPQPAPEPQEHIPNPANGHTEPQRKTA